MTSTITNTRDAAHEAWKMSQAGMSHKKISKELSRRGWISRRSNKPLTPAGVWILINRWEKGDTFENMRGLGKKAQGVLGRYAPRTKAKEATVHASQDELRERVAVVRSALTKAQLDANMQTVEQVRELALRLKAQADALFRLIEMTNITAR